MELKIKELCVRRGIASAYGLAKKSGLKMPTAYRAFANDIRQFTIETLGALCRALDCTPNDIFGVEPLRKMPDADTANDTKSRNATLNNSLQSNAALSNAASDNQTVIDGLPPIDEKNDMWLTTKQIAEYTNRKPRTVSDFYKQGLRRELTTKGSFVKMLDLVEFLKNRK
jgi:DNA-binding Xre family transcriptional regulator